MDKFRIGQKVQYIANPGLSQEWEKTDKLIKGQVYEVSELYQKSDECIGIAVKGGNFWHDIRHFTTEFKIGQKVKYIGGSIHEKDDEIVKNQVYKVEKVLENIDKISLVGYKFYHSNKYFIPASRKG